MELDDIKKNIIISRITTGIIYNRCGDNVYKLIPPTQDIRALADFFYRNSLENQKYKDILTREKAANYLEKNGIWTKKDDESLDKLQVGLDGLKIQLYNSLYKVKEQDKIRKNITKLNKAIEGSFAKKYMYDHMTMEAHAEKIRDEIIIGLSIKNLDESPVYSYGNIFKSNNIILTSFLLYLSKNIIDTKTFRYIARNEPFRLLWTIGKENMFGKPSVELTYEQKTIILYSRMYDNVYDSQERPSDDVINDDDMLDGWFADRRNKYEAERKKQEGEAILNKKGVKDGKGELFVVVGSDEEAKKIKDLNDLNTKQMLQNRQAVLQPGSVIPDEKMPDVQQELRQQAIQLMKSKRGG